MAFETQTINIQTKNTLGVSEFAVSTKVNIETDKPLKKVLSVKTLADIVSTESIDSDFTALGRTQVNILYLTENNQLECVTGFAEWQTSTKAVGEGLQAKVSVVEYALETATASEVSISILHNLAVEGITKQQLSPVGEFSDDYVTNTKTVSLNQINSFSSGKFVVSETIEMLTAQKVLSVDAVSKIRNVYCGIDQVTIEGDVDVKILYATADGISVFSKTLNFKQEVASLGALPDYSAFASLTVNSINATLEIAEKTNLVLAVSLNATVHSYITKELCVVDDLYSLNQNIETTVECVSYANYVASKYYADTVVCNVQIDGNNVDEIVALVSPTVQVSRYVLENSSILIEGVASASLVYRNNENDEVDSAVINLPFVSKVDTDMFGNLNELNLSCNIASAKIRSGREIEVVLDVVFATNIQSNEYFEYIKNIEELGEKQLSNSAITIYVTKENEKLFDVAKALNVLPDTITNQNEVVDGKFANGQRIFVYSPLNVEF